MKRTDAIKTIAELFEEHCNNQQYKGYSHQGLAETFLDIVERIGMKPPRVSKEDCQAIMSVYYDGYTFYQWDEQLEADELVQKAKLRRIAIK